MSATRVLMLCDTNLVLLFNLLPRSFLSVQLLRSVSILRQPMSTTLELSISAVVHASLAIQQYTLANAQALSTAGDFHNTKRRQSRGRKSDRGYRERQRILR